jgi:hypothetical protein
LTKQIQTKKRPRKQRSTTQDLWKADYKMVNPKSWSHEVKEEEPRKPTKGCIKP